MRRGSLPENIPDYYQRLVVSRTASKEEIRKAYLALARETHPDKDKAPVEEDRFKKINEAYKELIDKVKRARYDQMLRAQVKEAVFHLPDLDVSGTSTQLSRRIERQFQIHYTYGTDQFLRTSTNGNERHNHCPCDSR